MGEELAMEAWVIWKACTDVMRQNKMTTTTKVVLLARVTLNQWQHAQSNRMGSLSHTMKWDNRLEHWTKSNVNKIKLNVDNLLFKSEGKFGVGAVARDSSGTLLEGFSMSFHGRVEASFVEVIGIKEVLGWIKRKGWLDVQLETNCLVVV
uniref:RNase H type-1 domain-containing protein n=1 Tax=Cannabis sativa TaxID=3483 RepID=A0A803NU47_CANSA